MSGGKRGEIIGEDKVGEKQRIEVKGSKTAEEIER